MTSKNGTSCHSSNSSTENEVKLQIQNDVKKDELVVQMESIHVNVEKDDKITDVMTYYTRFPACGDVASKGTVLLLHDQTSSPSVWIQTETMQVLSSSGYTCIAIDLTRIYVEDEKRANYIDQLLGALEINECVLLGVSMAGSYLVPFLGEYRPKHFTVTALVAISLSGTHTLHSDRLAKIKIPCLVMKGSLDTSIGLSAANILSKLPNSKVVDIQNGKHLCHLSNPKIFHKYVLEFLKDIHI